MVDRRAALVRWARIGSLTVFGLVAAFVALMVIAYVQQPHEQWDFMTYLAAGERLNVGHQVYSLLPGDRPVVQQPPFAVGTLLSPPLIAVIWRPFAALPYPASVDLWWVLAAVAFGGCLLVMGVRRPLLTSAVTMALMLIVPGVLFQFTSANLNAFVVLGLVATWLLARSGHEAAAGAILAVLTQLKIVPAIFVWWLLLMGMRRGMVSFAITSVAVLAVTVFGAGPQAITDYLGVRPGPAPFSLGFWVAELGVPESVAVYAPIAFGILCAVAMVLLRRRPELTFVIAAFAMLFGSPAVNVHSYALLVVAIAPFVWRWARRDVPSLRTVFNPLFYLRGLGTARPATLQAPPTGGVPTRA